MPPGFSDVTDFAPIRRKREPSPFDGILEQARDLIYARLDEAIAAMLDKAGEALLTLVNETHDRDERNVYEEARELALQRRDVIESKFQEYYLEDFDRRVNLARKIGIGNEPIDVPLDELELVGEDDLDETIKFNDMAHKLRAYCEDELVALDQRVGVLLGDAGLQSKDNPFGPQVICDAYKHACRHLDVNLPVRRALLRLFDDHVLDDIRSVYKAVNTLLVRHSILPKIRFGVARPQDRAGAPSGPAGSDGHLDATAAEAAGAGAQDLFTLLQRLAASSVRPAGVAPPPLAAVAVAPGVAATVAAVPPTAAPPGAFPVIGDLTEAGQLTLPLGAQVVPPGAQVVAGGAQVLPAGAQLVPAGAVILQGAELLGSLTRIQKGDLSGVEGATLAAPASDPGTVNVLHQLKATSVGAGMGQMDLLTLDIIAMLFDQLFDDPKVPDGVKGLIGRLQIPMLKVAISDKSFFSSKSHPARRLLDAVGEFALRLPADFGSNSPLFGRLQETLQELVEGFHDDVAIFTATSEKLQALLVEEDQRIEQGSQEEARRAEQLETLGLARSVAQEVVKDRLTRHKLPKPVRDFLVHQWLKLLLLIHVKEGKEGRTWRTAIEVMDLLIWSVQPKQTPEDRVKLTTAIPRLIKHLTAGMRSAGVEDSARDEFFSRLMEYHTQAMKVAERETPRPEAPLPVAPAPAVRAASAGGAGEGVVVPLRPMSAAPRVRAVVENDSLDFTAPITVKNPYGGGEVKVDNQDLDFTATIDTARARREESIRRALDNLGVGTWVEFTDPDDPSSRRAARLIFVSPRKTRYLFAVDRAGKEIIQCTRAEIGRRLRIGEVVKLDQPPEESLFDRIMGRLLGKLRTPARTALFAQ